MKRAFAPLSTGEWGNMGGSAGKTGKTIRKDVAIRKYRRGDFKHYVDLLLLNSQTEYGHIGRVEVSHALQIMDKDWIWVAEVGGKAVGYATAVPEKGTLHMIWLDVHPDHQRTGIGSLLLVEVVKAGKSFGLGPLTVEVMDKNEMGINFYFKHGFRKKVWVDNYYHNGSSAFVMVKDI